MSTKYLTDDEGNPLSMGKGGSLDTITLLAWDIVAKVRGQHSGLVGHVIIPENLATDAREQRGDEKGDMDDGRKGGHLPHLPAPAAALLCVPYMGRPTVYESTMIFCATL